MTVIEVGSIVLGKSGRSLVVDRVDGDIICGGGVKIRATAACRVIPPPSIEDNMSPDNIQAVAESLSLICTFEEVAAIEVLTELRKIWDRDLLKAAAKLLTAEERRRLKKIKDTMKYKKGIAGLKQFVKQDHVDEETKKVYQEIIDNLESNQMIYRKLIEQHKEDKKNDINK